MGSETERGSAGAWRGSAPSVVRGKRAVDGWAGRGGADGESVTGAWCAFAPSPPAAPGEKVGVRGTLFANGLHDGLKHIPGTQQGVVVPEAQHAVTGRLQPLRALRIASGLIQVLATIQLHDELALHTTKVDEITRHRMLAAEFHSKLVGTQMRPQLALGVGHAGTEFAGTWHVRSSPSPQPSPPTRLGERGP